MSAKRDRQRSPAEEPAKSERDFEWSIAVGVGVLLVTGALVAVLPGWLSREPSSTPASSRTPAPATAPAPPAEAPVAARTEAEPPERSLTRERPAARSAPAQAAPVTKTSSPAPAADTRANTPPTQEALCSSILHKASLGEALTSEERKIIVACK